MADTPGRIVQLAGTVRLGGAFIDRGVLSSIQAASRKAGVDFAFMLAKARRESGFQTNASNATSSAQGLYQFTHQTWMEQIKRHGAEHGLGDLAARLSRRPGGGYEADDPETLRQVLALRQDPRISSAMAAEYAADNRRLLSRALGRTVGGTDLYLAHFLGPGGATSFLRALESRPDRIAAEVVPAAARANPSTFRAPDGRARTLAEVYGVVEQSIGGAMRRFASAAGLGTLSSMAPLPPSGKPDSPDPEDMGRLASARESFVPRPVAFKPPAPEPEDMGRTATNIPRPWAQKPLPENMMPPEEPPGPDTDPALAVVAAAGSDLDEPTLMRILAASSAPEAPPLKPVRDDEARALGLLAARTFDPAQPPRASRVAEAGTAASPADAGAPGVPDSTDALVAEALSRVSEEDRLLIASVVEAAQQVGARRGLSTADIAGSALRAFDALGLVPIGGEDTGAVAVADATPTPPPAGEQTPARGVALASALLPDFEAAAPGASPPPVATAAPETTAATETRAPAADA
ncbi:transglycosylase SLT domain-containing protein, partial [Pararhodospirillum oryzae]|uniref:transglycosylase SLT domain-containing protein n=1 Tax=Pararhodospirillum oryzae TaxID=478448 RepID=UPI001478716B